MVQREQPFEYIVLPRERRITDDVIVVLRWFVFKEILSIVDMRENDVDASLGEPTDEIAVLFVEWTPHRRKIGDVWKNAVYHVIRCIPLVNVAALLHFEI